MFSQAQVVQRFQCTILFHLIKEGRTTPIRSPFCPSHLSLGHPHPTSTFHCFVSLLRHKPFLASPMLLSQIIPSSITGTQHPLDTASPSTNLLLSGAPRTECYNEADPYKKAETFVGYLQRAVNGDYHKFYTFVQILQETDQTQIASRLRG